MESWVPTPDISTFLPGLHWKLLEHPCPELQWCQEPTQKKCEVEHGTGNNINRFGFKSQRFHLHLQITYLLQTLVLPSVKWDCNSSCSLSTVYLLEGNELPAFIPAPEWQSQLLKESVCLQVPPCLPASHKLPRLTGKTKWGNKVFEKAWQRVKCYVNVPCHCYYRWDLGLSSEVTLASSNTRLSTSVGSGLWVTAEHSAAEGHREAQPGWTQLRDFTMFYT